MPCCCTNTESKQHKLRSYIMSTHYKIYPMYGSNPLVINKVHTCNITKSWIMQKTHQRTNYALLMHKYRKYATYQENGSNYKIQVKRQMEKISPKNN